MANPEHLADLNEANLDKANLGNIDLQLSQVSARHFAGPKAGLGAILPTDNARIIIAYIDNAMDLHKIIARQPEDSPIFVKVAKKAALDIIGLALKDVAKEQMREAATRIYELGKDLGPVIINTAAYGFFKNCLGL